MALERLKYKHIEQNSQMASVEYSLEVVHLFRLHKVGRDDGSLVPVPEALEKMSLAVSELVLGKAYL